LPERFTATFRLCANGQITDYFKAALAQLPERFTATFRLCDNGQITDYLKAALAQLVERNLAKVEVTSSSLVCRSNFSPKEIGLSFKGKVESISLKLETCSLQLIYAALAQLVERNLAKVEVTSSSLVCRSNL
jgi:hypothetical protein